MVSNTNICHVRNRMISHFSFHASVFVGSLLRRFVCRGNLPFRGRWVVGEYRKTVVATYWHHHTGASHYCVTLTPPPPPQTPNASFSLSASQPLPLNLSLFLLSHQHRSLFDSLSTDNWSHSPHIRLQFLLSTFSEPLLGFVQLKPSFLI